MQSQRNFLLGVLCALSLVACSGDDSGTRRTGGDGGSAGSGATAGDGGGGLGGEIGTGGIPGTGGMVGVGGTGGQTTGCVPAMCPDGNSYGCGDCIDNDGDGLVDDRDPECLGPCDDTEDPVLLTGTPGELGSQCNADCYFDRGNGSAGDECQWHRECDELNPKLGCSYPPTPKVNDDICLAEFQCPDDSTCRLLTPNGCDCFGCCDVGGEGYVYLGSLADDNGKKIGTCTLDDVGDPELCRPCTPAGECLNECGHCELCVGKTELPADCFPGTGGSTGAGGAGGVGGSGTGGSPGERCADGVQACGLPGDPPCSSGGFCLTGCCILVQ